MVEKIGSVIIDFCIFRIELNRFIIILKSLICLA